MKNNFKIVEFDVHNAGEELWTAFFEHAEAIFRELEPEDPPLPREKRRALLKSAFEIPYVTKRMYLLLADGGKEAAGSVILSVENPKSPSYGENKHIANLDLSVLPACRRKGVGAALVRHVAGELAAKEPAVTEILAPVFLDCGRAFCEKAGGTVSLETAANRLYLKDADWALMRTWAEEGARRNPAAAVVKVSVIPEADIKNFCEVYTETINQQPLGDVAIHMMVTPEQLRHGERKNSGDGVEYTAIYTKESDGAVSGLTEIIHLKEAGYKVTQLLTGVRARCRGRGLGKLLKALMLLHVRAAYPGVRYISTGNADSNAPMLAINHKMGFKKHRPVRLYKLKLPLPGEFS